MVAQEVEKSPATARNSSRCEKREPYDAIQHPVTRGYNMNKSQVTGPCGGRRRARRCTLRVGGVGTEPGALNSQKDGTS